MPGADTRRERSSWVHDEIVKNPDGTKTARVRLSPKSFPTKDASGKKKDADTSLVDRGGRSEAANVAEPVSFASSSTDPELVSIGKKGRRVVLGTPNFSGLPDQSDSGQGKSSKRGVKAGEGDAREVKSVSSSHKEGKKNEVGFDRVFGQGTSLSYEVIPEGVKESIVIGAKPTGADAPVFRFPVNAEGLTGRAGKDAAIEFVDPAVVLLEATYEFRVASGGGNGYFRDKGW